ncbi:MAG: hypothetical protein AB1705_15455 [Verrucomicrobiota bacterium]
MTDVEIKELERVRAHAEGNRYTMGMLREVIAGRRAPCGDDERFVAHVEDYRVVASIEEQPCGWCWHVSFSKPGKGVKVMTTDEMERILAVLCAAPGTWRRWWVDPTTLSANVVLPVSKEQAFAV